MDTSPPEPETTGTDPNPEQQWLLLVDPEWQPSSAEDSENPPVEVVVGGWFVDADGAPGRFRPNPAYDPADPDAPTDPVDATLQLVLDQRADAEQLLETTREVVLGVGVDEQGSAVVAPAPDEVPSVLVATAPRHRERVRVHDWVEVTVEELAEALPDEGVDVLLNPGAPASMRLHAPSLRRHLAAEDPRSGVDAGGFPGGAEAAAESGAARARDAADVAGGQDRRAPAAGPAPSSAEAG